MSETETEAREVDYFTGSSFAVSEISLSVDQLRTWADSLTVGNKSRSAIQMKLTAEQISRVAGQTKALADVLVKTTTQHLNRRPRP